VPTDSERPATPADHPNDAADGTGEIARLRGEVARLGAALATETARLRTILDNAPIGIILADGHGQALYSNRGFRRILDLSSEEALRPDWVERLAEPDRTLMLNGQAELLAGARHEFSLDFTYHSPRRGTRVVRSRVVRVDDPHADFTFLGLGEDITAEREHAAAREQLLTQMQHAQRIEALGQLSGGIAHDFNNILAVVVGFGTLALGHATVAASPQLRDYLATLVGAGQRGRELVRKMLSFSRTTAEEHAPLADVATAVQEVVDMVRTMIPSSIDLTCQVLTASPPVPLSAVDLHQVLVNLLVNARDAVTMHGRIAVVVDVRPSRDERCASCLAPVTGQTVRISVRDDGTGMTDAVLNRVFEPFFTTKGVGLGTGMGLAMVHGIVHQSGGHVVVSTGPGAGTSFTLVLPACEVVTASHQAEAPAATTSLLDRHVLAVDDDQIIRSFLTEFLTGEGMRVTVAGNGREALHEVLTWPGRFDVVVTDETMPEMTGSELIATLRANGVTIPVVLCSGYDEPAARQLADHRHVCFVPKPATPAELLAALSRMVAGAE